MRLQRINNKVNNYLPFLCYEMGCVYVILMKKEGSV